MIIIILGAPGSGKGTQAELLSKKLYIPTISTGQLLREEAQSGSALGKEAESYMVKGDWVPSEITIKLLSQRLLHKDTQNGYILDAFPRLPKELTLFTDYLKARDKKIDLVINLRVDDNVSLGRIRHRRSTKNSKRTVRKDESDEVTRKRIELHHKTSKPILLQFRKMGLLEGVDGNKSVNEIQKDIYNIVQKKLALQNSNS